MPSSQNIKNNSPVTCTEVRINDDTNQTFYRVEYTAHDGRKFGYFAADICISPQSLMRALAERGYNGDQDVVKNLAKGIIQGKYPVTRTTARGGWIGKHFVTRNGSFGLGSDPQYVFDEENDQYKAAEVGGEVDDLIDIYTDLFEGSAEICLAYLAGLAAPLGSLIGRSSFSVCFSSESTTGKTSLIAFAQSLSTYAYDDQDLVNFGDTTGVLLNNLDKFGGLVTGFADIKNALEKRQNLTSKLQTITFSSASGQKRRRLGDYPTVTNGASKRTIFNLFLLSAERPLSEIFREAGDARDGGDMARLIEIPIASRADGGIFSKVDSAERQGCFERFDELRRSQYGTVMPEWVSFLAQQDVSALEAAVSQSERKFLAQWKGLDALDNRIGKQLAFLDAVIDIAGEADLNPAPLPVLHDAVSELFERIMTVKVAKQRDQLRSILRYLYQFLQKSFCPLLKQGTAPAKSQLSQAKICFKRIEGRAKVIHLHEASFVTSAGEGGGPTAKAFLRWLKDNIPLLEGQGNSLAKPVAQEGLERVRYLRFRSADVVVAYRKLKMQLRART